MAWIGIHTAEGRLRLSPHTPVPPEEHCSWRPVVLQYLELFVVIATAPEQSSGEPGVVVCFDAVPGPRQAETYITTVYVHQWGPSSLAPDGRNKG